jgi:hypothetical protein
LQVFVDANSPSLVLFTEEQLNDVQKFCAPEDDKQASVFGCDMTFKLGDFWVVTTTYRNLTVFSKQTGHPVTALGPVMVCKRKTREQYSSLFQVMTNKLPELKNSIRAFGQDGEKAILEAHSIEFPFAIGFLCSTHIKRNIEEYIKTSLHLSNGFFHVVCKDIFGDSTCEGLYHTTSRKDYDESLSKLKVKWNKIELEERLTKGMPSQCQFFSYFKKNKSEVIFNYCRQINAIDANVYHHNLFTANATESLNSAIKEWQSYQTEDLAKFVISLKEFVSCQRKEMLKPFLNLSSELVVNPRYKEHVNSGYWESSGMSNKFKFLLYNH